MNPFAGFDSSQPSHWIWSGCLVLTAPLLLFPPGWFAAVFIWAILYNEKPESMEEAADQDPKRIERNMRREREYLEGIAKIHEDFKKKYAVPEQDDWSNWSI